MALSNSSFLATANEQYTRHLARVSDRHNRALVEHGFDGVVIASGSPHMQFLDDMSYPFKTNPQFKAWVPLTCHPDSFIIYTPDTKPVLVYYQPDDYWHKTPDSPSGYWVEHFEIKIIHHKQDAKQFIPPGTLAFLGETPERYEDWGNFNNNPSALVNQLDFERAWKTTYEIACMEQASYLGALGHRAAYLAFMHDASEYEIHLAFCAACEHSEDQLPYDSIVALNTHAAILHYTYRETANITADKRHSFLLDAGAGFNGYASDITRTYAYHDGLFFDLVQQMDELQQIVCDQALAGVHYPQLHLDTHRAIGGVLHSAGVINISGDDAAESGLTSTFYPHGLGHYIGLQVHDVGGFMRDTSGEHMKPPPGHEFLRLTRTLEARQVLTIEPGLYLIESLLRKLKNTPLRKSVNWNVVEQLMPFGGIRIEDNIVVTEGAPVNLTRDAFDKLDHTH